MANCVELFWPRPLLLFAALFELFRVFLLLLASWLELPRFEFLCLPLAIDLDLLLFAYFGFFGSFDLEIDLICLLLSYCFFSLAALDSDWLRFLLVYFFEWPEYLPYDASDF